MEYVWAVLRLTIIGAGLWLLVEIGSWHAVIGIAIFIGVLVFVFFIKALIDAAKLPREELEKRVEEREAEKMLKGSATTKRAAKNRKKKSGPLFGSRSVEATLLGENNHIAGRWAARKARDKFFRF